jgi:hypothetical protein
MEITETNEFNESVLEKKYHVLTFAETGFAMLNIYGKQFGLDRDTIEEFSRQVNRKDESGSLYPKAPISAVPRRLIRDDNDSVALAGQIIDFLKANKQRIKASKLLFDFRAGVAPFVITACKLALESEYVDGINEVVIINEN